MKQLTRFLLAGLALTVALAASAALPVRLEQFDAYAERVLREFDVPGMAVAVVQNGEVVLARGYGLRELGQPERVDSRTLFAIASNTKAFTSTLLAQLVDEKKLQWDDRVIDHLPWFAMSDPYVTREMTIRDLLVHRSGLGLGAGDLLFWPATDYTTEEVVQRLKFIPLATSFRSAYAYDNILYAVAGLVIERISGRTWEQNVRERIFAPAGMTDAKANCIELQPTDNAATGHAKFDFKDLRPVPPMAWDNNSAAGGIYANVIDLSRWMQVQLDAGLLAAGEDGTERRLFSAARQKDMWTLVTPMPFSLPPPALAEAKRNFRGYALGWEITDFRGQRLVTHTGGWPGQVSRTTLVPDLKLGIVVLTNQEVGAAFQAVTMHLLDAFLGAPEKDWCAAYVDVLREGSDKADASWAKLLAGRNAASGPSLPLASYAGTYRDAWYGDVLVRDEEGKLVVQFSRTGQLLGDVEHWQHDSFIIRWRDRSLNADAFLTFALHPDGTIREARMEAISALTDFSFDFHDLRLAPVKE
ncbi:MAG: serine hydrolase [Candidatus Didemnitutus sp.]|nr:serine hydrolase [Candidatus Didemnitutus sp.]